MMWRLKHWLRVVICVWLLLAAMVVMVRSQQLGSLPRRMLRDTALRMSGLLENASFRGRLVHGIAIEGSGRQEGYVLRVLLEQTGSQLWDMHTLRRWSQNGDLVLSGNRALIFPQLESNRFDVLDKNRFVSLVLRSSVYAKVYEGEDVLAGEVVLFGLRSFNLVEVLRLEKSYDVHGYRHQYVLELSNGNRELVSYRQAYNILSSSGLGETRSAQNVVHEVNRLENMRALPVTPQLGKRVSQFGLELQYAEPVKLSPQHYRFQVRERRGILLDALNTSFFLEIVLPNVSARRKIGSIRRLGFLENLKVEKHPDSPNRLLLVARLDPQFFTTPPYVQIRGNTVRFVFTQLEDLTVFDPQVLEEAEKFRKQQKVFRTEPSLEAFRDNQRYSEHMRTGLGQIDEASAKIGVLRFDLELSALLNFLEAARFSSNDLELATALEQRDRLIATLPQRLANFAEEAIASGVIELVKIQQLLFRAEAIAPTPDLRERIRDLINRSLGAPRL